VREKIFLSLVIHIDTHLDLSLAYFLLSHIDDANIFFKVVKHVIDDVSLRIQKYPSNLFVISRQFPFLLRHGPLFDQRMHHLNTQSFHILEVVGYPFQSAPDIYVQYIFLL
jgi:hypothetical protein